jgi:hypothetical protein
VIKSQVLYQLSYAPTDFFSIIYHAEDVKQLTFSQLSPFCQLSPLRDHSLGPHASCRTVLRRSTPSP